MERTVRKENLVRLNELRNAVLACGCRGNYFENFDSSLDDDLKLRHLARIEEDLAELDDAAWSHLKAGTIQRFIKSHPERGWQFAFDKLNEAKGYNYLKKMGCVNIKFIPESSEEGQKTPDLRADWNMKTILCEVKTINISNRESAARKNEQARYIEGELSDSLIYKIKNTINAAKMQFDAYKINNAKKIIYMVLNFDDSFHEYVENYLLNLQAVALEFCAVVGVVFDIKPKFYSANPDQSPIILSCLQ
jgi:hypothetical protein